MVVMFRPGEGGGGRVMASTGIDVFVDGRELDDLGGW